MHDLCSQEANLFPFRMKLIVKFFSFEFQHPVYSILYKVSFLHSIACNVDIIQQLHLLLLGNHNENKNTSPRRFQVSSHHWCDKDTSSFVVGKLCSALQIFIHQGNVPMNTVFQNLCYKTAQYIHP